MLKIILLGLICTFVYLIIRLVNVFLVPKKEEKKENKVYMAVENSFTVAKEQLESKIEFYKKKASEGSVEAKEKLNYYEQELKEITKFENQNGKK